MSKTEHDEASSSGTCPRCGGPLSGETAGVCPRCLLGLALDSPGNRPGAPTVSHYEVGEKLGAGGMGEVFRARDTRLARDVALKLLPDFLSTDPERLARLRHEALVLASIDHPNIAQVHGLEDTEDTLCIVMEFVEGEGLDRRIAKRPIQLAEALSIARQIAEALEAAHAKGVVHRDLKPSNIRIRSDEVVKVLDFGLAKTVRAESEDGAARESETLATDDGMILGTPTYMSPEQAHGRHPDRRVDVWAFGCVLYELLTGSPPFGGEDAAETLAAILRAEPDFSKLPAATPPSIRRLLDRCLQKDPRRRLPDMGSARLEIDDGLAELEQPNASPESADPRTRARATRLAIAALVVAGIGFAAGLYFRGSPASTPEVVRLNVIVPDGEEITAAGPFDIALSPDGTLLAYTSGERPRIENLPYGRVRANGRLYLRSMDGIESRPVPGTEGAVLPFFSPNAEWIGFRAEGKLKKVAVEVGSVPEVVSDVPPAYGASWGPDGYIYYHTRTDSDVLVRVPESGGVPKAVTQLDALNRETAHRWPQVLPGGNVLLFTVFTGPGWDERHIHALRLDTGERRELIRGGSTGQYIASGHIVYSAGTSFRAVPVDLDRLEVTGPPVALNEQIVEGFEGAAFVVSPSGSLAYVPQGPERYERDLVWVDRQGSVDVVPVMPAGFSTPAVSPDGRYAAVNVAGARLNIWIYDFSRGTLSPLSAVASTQAPLWTPDGTRIAYRSSNFRYGSGISWKSADGSGEEELLTVTDNIATPSSFSPDGRWLAYEEDGNSWLLPLDDASREPRPLLQNTFAEVSPRISPDGRWLAYESDEAGSTDVYVRPFPDVDRARWSISNDGGSSPLWSRDGSELFYRGPRGLMAVPVTASPDFSAGAPEPLFADTYMNSPTGGVPGYDVSPDGSRFLFVRTGRSDPSTRIRVVLNLAAELGGN